MTPSIRFNGIYDLATLTTLKDEGIFSFCFDLNPKSLNFIQQYKLVQIVEKMNPTDEIYLSFTNEKYEIVSYLRNEVLQHSVSDKIFLEFKDRPEPNLDQYQTPYIVHWHQHYDFSDLKKLKNCIGICFNEQFLRDLQVTHDYFAIVEQIINLKTSLKMKIMLELNQTSLELPTGKDITLDSTRTILNGLTQELEIDIVSVNIHKGLETRYRDIDVNMLKNAAKMSVNMFQE